MRRRWSGSGRRPSTDDRGYFSSLLSRFRSDASRRRPPVADNVDRGFQKVLEVDDVEFYCKDNARVHHTEDYDIMDGKDPCPVLRRGELFFFSVRFNRQCDFNSDMMKLHFSTGPRPLASKGTLVSLSVGKKARREDDDWQATIVRTEKTILTVQVQVPPYIAVGLWRLRIETRLMGSQYVASYECKESIYIIFNPWCKDDAVYLPDSKAKLEYVLSDVGKIYVGSHKNPVGRPWVFGQFAESVLPASVFLLEKSSLDFSARGNPVKIVRTISALVNSNDDGGVLMGNWSGDYEDGTAPWSWTGSAAILQQYLSSAGKPVKYGQCWVFSGVVTTVCRALGIPCRSVTNFVSAHDTDDSLTVDKYFDADGNQLEDLNHDSIWNFHCWNDCWMSRPDLPPGYGGWQAIDSTPQETSEGWFRVGPASLAAVQRGAVGHPFDTPFVFAEVNADIVHWQADPDSKDAYNKLFTNTYHVGRLVVTKHIGLDDDRGTKDMEDITSSYKQVEGSTEERLSVLNAARRGAGRRIYDMPAAGAEDVRFRLHDIEKISMGDPFRVVVEVENKSDRRRTLTAVLSASSIHYTGVLGRKLKRARSTFILEPRGKEELGIEVGEEEYVDKLVDYALVKIYAIINVKETRQTWADEDDFQITKPTLHIKVEGDLKVYRRFKLHISFQNPLKRTLEECSLTLEGPGLADPFTIKLDDVKPSSLMSHVVTLTPRKSGSRKITALFTSRQLIEIIGSKQVLVKD